jgi:NAD(P)-dependent dehydrogenase (short-subunit alcohol dehydrogenase family)
MEHRERVIIVTGASSGIGNACATHLAKRGFKVYGTSRTPSSYTKKADEFFDLIQMDITDEASVNKGVASVLEKEGHIDALVCNAGMGIAGSVEDSSLEEIGLQMNTNYFGALRCVKAVLPVMRSAKAGRIIVLSSIAGVVGMPFQAFYSSSKYALEGLIESLRYETRPFGIEAALIEPGDFHTGFTGSRKVAAAAAAETSAYKKYYDAAMGIQVRDETSGHDPIEVAKLVVRLLDARHLKIRYTVGPGFERFAVMLKRLIPGKAFEFFYRKYYKLP